MGVEQKETLRIIQTVAGSQVELVVVVVVRSDWILDISKVKQTGFLTDEMRHVEERKDSSVWLKTLRIWFKQLEGLMEMKQVWSREKGRISAWDVVGINHFL